MKINVHLLQICILAQFISSFTHFRQDYRTFFFPLLTFLFVLIVRILKVKNVHAKHTISSM